VGRGRAGRPRPRHVFAERWANIMFSLPGRHASFALPERFPRSDPLSRGRVPCTFSSPSVRPGPRPASPPDSRAKHKRPVPCVPCVPSVSWTSSPVSFHFIVTVRRQAPIGPGLAPISRRWAPIRRSCQWDQSESGRRLGANGRPRTVAIRLQLVAIRLRSVGGRLRSVAIRLRSVAVEQASCSPPAAADSDALTRQ
jgi:hypothetical protein